MKSITSFFRSALLMCILFMSTLSYAQPNVYHSVDFSTTTTLSMPNTTSILADNSIKKMTVEAWVKQHNTAYKQTIINAQSSLGYGYTEIIDIHIQADSLYASYGNGYIACYLQYDSTTWHHIAFTIDSAATSGVDSLSLYVDGMLKTSLAITHISHIRSGKFPHIGSLDSQHVLGIDKFIGHMTRFVITDSVLYTTSFIPDCVFDTTTINSKTRLVLSLTNSNYTGLDYVYVNGGGTAALDGGSYYYIDTTLKNSPCMPIYTFSTDTTYAGDTIMFYAHNVNTSFDKGSTIQHIKNGFDTTITVTSVTGLFTDSIMILHYGDTSVTYTDESGDTTQHGARQSLLTTSVNSLAQHTINIYPNPSYGTYRICNTIANVTIYDMMGRIVKQYYVNGTYTDTLDAGTYIICINKERIKLIIK